MLPSLPHACSSPSTPAAGVQGSSKVISIPQRDLVLVLACHKFNSLLSDLVTMFFLTTGLSAWACLPNADVVADSYFVRKSAL